jgi:hypothetical protein
MIDRYLINTSDIPEGDRNYFVSLNKAIQKAFNNPGKLTRVHSGFYYVVINNELIEIDNQDDEGGEWIAKEASPKTRWYTDGAPTLKELKKELGLL